MEHEEQGRHAEGEDGEALGPLAPEEQVEDDPPEREALRVGDEEERDVVEPEATEVGNRERVCPTFTPCFDPCLLYTSPSPRDS